MARHLWNETFQRCVWRCDGCGKTAFWDENWSWYGSWRDADNDNIFAACSADCMKKRATHGEVLNG